MTTEVRGSQPQAFDVEYSPKVHSSRLRDEVMTYLGEYRFKLKEQPYTLIYDGKLRDPHELSLLSESAKRSIAKRKIKGSPTHREEHDLRGILNLEDQLRVAASGDTVFWASPPGPSNEGYGDHGFVYWGKVKKNGSRTEIGMVATRVEEPNITQFNRFLSSVSGLNVNFQDVDPFLAFPVVVRKDYKEAEIYGKLFEAFGFQKDENEKTKVAGIEFILKPRIDEFLRKIRFGTKEEKQRVFYTLENFSILLWQGKTLSLNAFRNLDDMVQVLGYEPPKIMGSCGSSGGMQTNGLSSFTNGFNGLSEELEWFTCPKCHYKADGPVGNKCPGCGITKEEFAKDGGVVC